MAAFLLTFLITVRVASFENCESTSDDVVLLQSAISVSRKTRKDNSSTLLRENEYRTTSAHKLYCPIESDMNHEDGHVKFENGGWSFLGISRVSSKTAWNLLGGYVEFDMDTTGTSPGVNTNLYTSSIQGPNCGMACYCDIQKGDHPSCMEIDIVEVNGHCAAQSTVHTFATDGIPNNPDCDRWGCESHAILSGGKFHMKAEFGLDGSMTTFLDGRVLPDLSPPPSDASNKILVDTMNSLGGVIESSQWFGWAPATNKCPHGTHDDIHHSRVSISNVRVFGTTKQGPEATLCGAPAPPPPPPSPPCCSWSGTQCDPTTDYCKASQDHCENDCHGTWTDPAKFPPLPDGCCSWYGTVCGETSDWCKASKVNCESDCGGKWIQV